VQGGFNVEECGRRVENGAMHPRRRNVSAPPSWSCIAPFILLAAWLGAFPDCTLGNNATNPAIRSVGGGRFEIGHVSLDKVNRTVSFPASVNLRDATVEYAVVHTSGKTHESVFSTDARPHDIHLALLLLGARPVVTNFFGADGKATPLGEKVWINVHWTNGSCALEDLVVDRETGKPMTRGDWIFNGSNFSEGASTAQRDGSIVSIHIDPDALIDNPRPGRENDDLHLPHAAKLPPVGTPAEIRIYLGRSPTNAAVAVEESRR
jgi:hypothetical protein